METVPRAIRVLVAEDEGIVAMDLGHRLKKLGYVVVGVVSRGEEAIRLAITEEADVVLMDVHLGGALDGVEAGKRIYDIGGPPVIFATAFSEADTIRRARIANPFGYLLKPFQEEMIQVTIEMAVCRWKAENEVRQREQLLSATVRAVRDAVIAVDGSLLITFVNPAAEGLTGWKSTEALKSPIWTVLDLYAPDGSSLHINPMTENPTQPLNLLLRTKDGEMLDVTLQKLSFDRGDEDKNSSVFVLSRASTQGSLHKVGESGSRRET